MASFFSAGKPWGCSPTASLCELATCCAMFSCAHRNAICCSFKLVESGRRARRPFPSSARKRLQEYNDALEELPAAEFLRAEDRKGRQALSALSQLV